MPSCARDSASRDVATRTSKFSAATWRSSAVSSRSLKSVHQLGSTAAATGSDRSGDTFSLGPVNQELGDAQDGAWKFGPTVHPQSASAVLAARTTRSIAPH